MRLLCCNEVAVRIFTPSAKIQYMGQLNFVDLKNFGARDISFKLRYFKQFTELVGQRLPQIKNAHLSNDREQLWRSLHGARPQLLFFGIEKVKQPMEEIEQHYSSMSQSDLDLRVKLIVEQIEGATKEIEELTVELEHQA